MFNQKTQDFVYRNMAKFAALLPRLDGRRAQDELSGVVKRVLKPTNACNDPNPNSLTSSECSCISASDSVLKRKPRKGHWWQLNSGQMVSLMVCLAIINIPIICIYIGYSIGMYFMPPAIHLPSPGIIMDMASMNYTWYNTHNITIKFLGGLGNQMFQYASLYGLGKANGLRPLIDDQSVVAKTFQVLRARRTNELDAGRDYGSYLERRSNAFDQRTFSLNFMRNIRLEGFFQSWRYFDHIRSDLRKQFAFRTGVVKLVDEFLHEAGSNFLLKHHGEIRTDNKFEVKFVGVHIRRGDFLDGYNVKKGYTVADKVYLDKAMRYYENKYKMVVFVICSDDTAWSQENLDSDKYFIMYSKFPASNPQFDMCLLSKCNHSIITVGTFGWWGAWLAGGETVYYRDYPQMQSPLRDNFRFNDYYLPQWIAM